MTFLDHTFRGLDLSMFPSLHTETTKELSLITGIASLRKKVRTNDTEYHLPKASFRWSSYSQ